MAATQQARRMGQQKWAAHPSSPPNWPCFQMLITIVAKSNDQTRNYVANGIHRECVEMVLRWQQHSDAMLR